MNLMLQRLLMLEQGIQEVPVIDEPYVDSSRLP